MAELLLKHLYTPMALVHLDKLLNIRERVWLAITVRVPIGARLACKLANACKWQKAVRSAEAFDHICMQVRLHAVVNIAPKLLL